MKASKLPVMYYPTLVALVGFLVLTVILIVEQVVKLPSLWPSLSNTSGLGGLWVFVGLPIMLLVVASIFMGIIVVEWLAVKGMRTWNTRAMVIGAVISPLIILILCIGLVTTVSGRKVPDYTVFILVAMYVVAGVATYNDWKYRKRKLA